jgi:phage gpG-like protein
VSNTTGIRIEVDSATREKIAQLQTLPQRTLNAIARAMDQENQLTIGEIKTKHLTGNGPFPVDEHRLGRVTGRLRGSINASESQINGNQVDSSIGSNVKYAAIHEFGGTIPIPARKQTIRHKVDARGNLVKQLTNSNLLVFGNADAKRVRETTVSVAAHEIEMPERAPIRTGIDECKPNYTRSIGAAIKLSFTSGK